MNGRLYRSRDERVLAGVAGGLADYLDLDPSLVRILWVILALFSGGAFLVIYIIMAIVVPEEPWQGFATPAPHGSMPPAMGASAGPGGTDAATGDAATAGSAAFTAGAPAAGPSPTGWSNPADWRAQRAAWRAQRRADRAAWRAAGHDSGQTAGLVFGLILLVIGVVFLIPVAFPAFEIGRFWPVLVIGLGVVLVVAALRPRP
jgi:phage shock protein C